MASGVAGLARRAVEKLALVTGLRRPSAPLSRPDPLMPPPVRFSVTRGTRAYWRDRVVQCPQDYYAGVQFAKYPEDLRTYEHILWQQRTDTVIEIGTMFGGSALWFRDRLRMLQAYGRISDLRIISIDIDTTKAGALLAEADPDFASTITLLSADIRDPELPDVVAEHVPQGARPLVVEDSAHIYATTMAALQGFARFVPTDGYFVVEDGWVDVEEMRIDAPGLPHGVLPAVRDWLETAQGRSFRVERAMELYGVTSHPGGFLRRVRADEGR